MPKLKMKDSPNNLENWLLYFQNEGKEEKIVEDIIIKDDLIDKVHQDYNTFMEDEKLRIQALSREMGHRDHLSRMNYAKKAGLEKGMKKGLEQGLEQGERQKAQAIAVKLLNRGMTVKEISEITSLSLEEIEGMKK